MVGWSAAAATGGCWYGIRPGRGLVRSSSAATTTQLWRWRCCRMVGWSAAAHGGCWCGTRPGSGADPVELGRHDGRVGAVAVLPDGRVVSGGVRRAGAGVGSVPAGSRPSRARPPRRLGEGGGGVAGWSGGQRRGATGGCWCGIRPSRGLVRSSSAATTARWWRWRCCRTVGWSAAGYDGRVLVWDPSRPGDGPVELGAPPRLGDGVAVLPDGRVVSGGLRRAGAGVGSVPAGGRSGRARPPPRLR